MLKDKLMTKLLFNILFIFKSINFYSYMQYLISFISLAKLILDHLLFIKNKQINFAQFKK